MKKNKVYNKDLKMRCRFESLKYPSKVFKVFIIMDTPARIAQNQIFVDNSFLTDFNKQEQEAILQHEEYHKKVSTFLKKIWNIFRFFSIRKARYQEEFDADKYSSLIVGRDAVKSFLIKSKQRYNEGKVLYDKRSHPKIEQRLQNIEINTTTPK